MFLSDRERDFENRFIHDQELKYRIRSRRNKLIGLWAAEKLGKDDASAMAYAQDLVRVDFEKPGDKDVLDHLKDDLENGGTGVSEAEIRAKMEELLHEAEKQVMTE